MSSTLELPGVDEAIQNLDAIYAQRFLDKLAEYGYEPQSEEAAIAALHSGAQLDAIPEPTPTAQNDPFMAANEKLANVLQQRGVNTPEIPAVKQAETERTHLAVMLAKEPEFFKSAVALANSLSEADNKE